MLQIPYFSYKFATMERKFVGVDAHISPKLKNARKTLRFSMI
jgi:hypothetical protein